MTHRGALGGLLTLAAACGLLGGTAAHAQAPVLQEIHTLSSTAEPVEQSFGITVAGAYEVKLTDLGAAFAPPAGPAALAAVKLAVMREATVVKVIDGTGVDGGVSTAQFDATAGTYTIRVVGVPGTNPLSGAIGVQVTRLSDSNVVFAISPTLSRPAAVIPPNRVQIEATLTVTSGGDYEVSLADLQLPQSLTTLTLVVAQLGGGILAQLPGGPSQFNAPAGDYPLFVIAESDATVNAGLFSVNVRPTGGGDPIFSRTVELGRVKALGPVTLAAGTQWLTLADFGFPAPLSQAAAIVTRQGAEAARRGSAGETAFVAEAGEHQVFALATAADPPGTGAYGVQIRSDAGAAVFSSVQSTGNAAGTTPAFSYSVDVATAGSYRLRLADLQFPAAFGSLALAAVQDGALINPQFVGADSRNVTLAAGKVTVFVIAKPSSQAGSLANSGLFGVDLAPAAGGETIFDVTQGVGALFSARKLSITSAGRYQVTVDDALFPKRFLELAAVVTRGADKLGSIFGGGSFPFDAVNGNYVINFIARADPAESTAAGTYVIQAVPVPPIPGVTFEARPGDVQAGNTVRLEWSTQNATTCSASGGGWSGTKAPSGAENSPVINAATTFTLSCTGIGGTNQKSVTVNVVAQTSDGGGGGRYDLLALLLLAALTVHHLTDSRRRGH